MARGGTVTLPGVRADTRLRWRRNIKVTTHGTSHLSRWRTAKVAHEAAAIDLAATR
jgi:hypothetical protein